MFIMYRLKNTQIEKYPKFQLYPIVKVVTVVTVDEWMTMRSPSWSEDSQELDPDEDSQAMFFSPCCQQWVSIQTHRADVDIINSTFLQQVPLRRPSKRRKLLVEAQPI